MRIICATLMRTVLRHNSFWRFPDQLGGICIDDYNKAIRRAARNCHVDLADLAECGRQYETLDGTHPTSIGHQTIADAWTECLSRIM